MEPSSEPRRHAQSPMSLRLFYYTASWLANHAWERRVRDRDVGWTTRARGAPPTARAQPWATRSGLREPARARRGLTRVASVGRRTVEVGLKWAAGAHALWWHEGRGGLGVMVGGALTGLARVRHAPEPHEMPVPPVESTVRMTPCAPRSGWCASAARDNRACAT